MINTRPIESIITIIKKHHLLTKVIFFSSDYVFKGDKGFYCDNDLPNPSTNYGKTKFLAEQALLNSGLNFKIVRTCAVMGKGGVFFDWLLNNMSNKREISLFDNVFFSPTPVIFLSEIIEKLILNFDTIPEKIIHISGEKRLSRYEFALILKDILNSNILIKPEIYLDQNLLLQYDLSLISSDIINSWRFRNFNEYIKDEIKNASIY